MISTSRIPISYYYTDEYPWQVTPIEDLSLCGVCDTMFTKEINTRQINFQIQCLKNYSNRLLAYIIKKNKSIEKLNISYRCKYSNATIKVTFW